MDRIWKEEKSWNYIFRCEQSWMCVCKLLYVPSHCSKSLCVVSGYAIRWINERRSTASESRYPRASHRYWTSQKRPLTCTIKNGWWRSLLFCLGGYSKYWQVKRDRGRPEQLQSGTTCVCEELMIWRSKRINRAKANWDGYDDHTGTSALE